MSSGQIRETQNYIWNVSNILGRGATSIVYMGRKKCNGEEVAVKVFSQPSDSRTMLIQRREFAVLKMLCHNNVVQLYAMEPDLYSNIPVLVMQFCSEGTLFRMLQKPEFAYGMHEEEFLVFLHDITAGMKHLREHQIVHRDIKPGNILCYKAESGRYVYKLTDFGAARALDDTQEFMSLYGTEEYLHPDLYDVAVMKKSMGRKFDAAVDLWSLAVTIYQVATGQLPFQPYGGRKNRTTMHKILADKKSGVVSGIQKSFGGEIEWSEDFPNTCLLSQGLKNFLLPFLAGLLERDSEKTWNFDTYFQKIQEIISKTVIYVFSPEHFSNFRIYIDGNQNYTNLQELIATQTDINAASQLLLFEGHLLTDIINPLQHIATYPHITINTPIFLLVAPSRKQLMLDQFIPEFPITKIEEIHSAERAQLRTCLNVVFFIKRLVVNINLKQKLLQDALRHSMTYLKQSFLNQSESVANTSWIKNTLTSLRNLSPQLNELTTKMIKIEDVLQKRRSAFDLEFLGQYGLKTGCMESDHCVPTITNLANHTQEISTRLLDNTNRDNLDKFQELDKSRFLENCKKAGELIGKHCQPNAIRLYSEFQEASEKVWTQRKIFQASNGELKVFSNLLEKYQASKFTKDLNKEMFHDNNEDLIFHMMKRVQNLTISIQECTEDVKTLGVLT